MKKALLFALAALCVSAAQAVVATWNSTDGDFSGFKDANNQNIAVKGEFSVKFVFSMSGNDTTQKIFQLCTAAGADQQGEFRFIRNGDWTTAPNFTGGIGTFNDANNASWVNTSGDFSYARLQSTAGTGKNTLTISLSGYDSETKLYSKVAYSVIFADGSTQSERVITPADNNPYGFGLDEITWTELKTDSVVTMHSMTLTNVPEPTALALLALGVAGLALKRKVA